MGFGTVTTATKFYDTRLELLQTLGLDISIQKVVQT